MRLLFYEFVLHIEPVMHSADVVWPMDRVAFGAAIAIADADDDGTLGVGGRARLNYWSLHQGVHRRAQDRTWLPDIGGRLLVGMSRPRQIATAVPCEV
jgi:hypothetical protein